MDPEIISFEEPANKNDIISSTAPKSDLVNPFGLLGLNSKLEFLIVEKSKTIIHSTVFKNAWHHKWSFETIV